MKATKSLLVLPAIALVFALTIIACDNGTGGGGRGPFNPGRQQPVDPLTAEYVYNDEEGNKYKLVITEVTTTKAAIIRALDPNKNYEYELTITFAVGGTVTSTGTASVTDVEITLTHFESETTVTVTVSSTGNTNTIISIYSESGKIPVDKGDDVDIPEALIPADPGGEEPAHTHVWGEWTVTTAATETEDGVETKTCTLDPSHIKETRTLYATGTPGLAFEAIGSTAYRVRKGAVRTGAVHIPAYHRPNASSPYLPVTEIGGFDPSESHEIAFSFSSITSITIPASVTSIGERAFESCTLTSVTFAPNSQLKSIGVLAFLNCSSLTNITIPASVTSIGEGAFNSCFSLTSVTFAPNSKLETIGDNAFQACASLTSITIPAGVTSIGVLAFSSYSGMNLTSVTFAPNSQLKSIGFGAFSNCFRLTGITIPAGVTSIGELAFQLCGLTNITIPESVTSIGEGAFEGCTDLTSVTFAPNSKLKTIDYGTFSGCTSLTSITIPSSITSIGHNAFSNCTSLTNITIPANVTSIGVYAFYRCTSLTSITIPASVTYIGENPFKGCVSLQTINVQGKANRAATIAAGWDSKWDDDIWFATINYNAP